MSSSSVVSDSLVHCDGKSRGVGRRNQRRRSGTSLPLHRARRERAPHALANGFHPRRTPRAPRAFPASVVPCFPATYISRTFTLPDCARLRRATMFGIIHCKKQARATGPSWAKRPVEVLDGDVGRNGRMCTQSTDEPVVIGDDLRNTRTKRPRARNGRAPRPCRAYSESIPRAAAHPLRRSLPADARRACRTETRASA